MIKNYFIIAWRNLLRNKLYSFINIFGLAIGISCCMLIYFYVNYERSYDTFHKEADNIYRLTLHVHQPQGDIESAATAPLMGPAIQENFPEILKMARLSLPSEKPIAYNGKKLYDNKVAFADSTFFDVFSFPVIEGDQKTSLDGPYKIVITQSMAKKFFGNERAVGKIMDFNNSKLSVSAVIKDVPENSHFKFDALLSRSTLLATIDSTWKRDSENNWYWIFQYTYFLIDKSCNAKTLEAKISDFTSKQYPERKKIHEIWYDGKLQPLKDIHLKSAMDREIMPNGDIKYVYIFSGASILILLIACFNFINLSTARSLNRSKEIGLRKVVGAGRYQLIQQFLGESLLFTFIAGFCSLILVGIMWPYFNSFAGIHPSIHSGTVITYTALIVLVGLLAGLYPALLISSFKPVKALKGHIRHGLQDIIFRKGLVVFQFSIAVILIVGTQVIINQLSFLQNSKLGMQKEKMLQIKLINATAAQKQTFFDQLKSDPGIASVCFTNFSFKSLHAIPLQLLGKQERQGYNAYPVIYMDENFLETFQLSLVAGRNLSKDFPQDPQESFLVNETAVKVFGWKTPQLALGKEINWAGEKQGKVVGVVKDFNYASLHDEIKPLIMHTFRGINAATVRLKTNDIPKTIKSIENKWKTNFSDVPFKYSFMQDDFDFLYKSEQKLGNLLGAFTGLSILVACLGLFGLAAYNIKQRVKEIGVRKILGATLSDIATLVSKDFLKLVLVSIVIAIPVAWYAAHKWLEDFAYKTEVSWWIFVSAAAVSIIIAIATVSFQAVKAALNNPVKSLRNE